MHRCRRIGSVAGMLGLVAVVAACVKGGQSGDGEPIDRGGDPLPTGGGPNLGEGGLGGGCSYEPEPVQDLSAAIELDFAPQAAIDHALGTYETTVSLPASERLTVGPESGTVDLTLTIEYDGGEVRFRRPVMREPGDGREGGGLLLGGGEIGALACNGAYEIDARLRLRTPGGTLDEVLDVTLTAASPTLVQFSAIVPQEDLRGSLELTTTARTAVFKALYIHGTLSPFGTFGDLSAAIDYPAEDPNLGASSMGPIGRWPAGGACDGQGLPVTADTDLGGYTLASELTVLDGLFPRSLTWQTPVPRDAAADAPQPDPNLPPEEQPDAAWAEPQFETVGETKVTLAIEQLSGGEACARVEGTGFSFALPVDVTASTDDGRLAGRYKGTLSATAGAEGLESPQLQADMGDIPVDALSEQGGIRDVDLSGYDYGRINLRFDVDADQGHVQVQGADVADCVTNPPEPIRDEQGNVVGVPGCRGTDLVVVLQGIF